MDDHDPADAVAMLRARVANLEQMATRMAHELQTPLTAAYGFATLLLRRPDLPPGVREDLERIERATGDAMAMLRSRVEEGVGERPRSLRLRTLVEDVAAATPGAGEPAGGTLPDAARVFGDPAALRSALGLVLGAVRQHVVGSDRDPTTVGVDLVETRPSGHVLRITADAPPLGDAVRGQVRDGSVVAEESEAGRLRRASALLAPLGGHLWLDDPAAADGLSLLLQLPRDVAGADGDV